MAERMVLGLRPKRRKKKREQPQAPQQAAGPPRPMNRADRTRATLDSRAQMREAAIGQRVQQEMARRSQGGQRGELLNDIRSFRGQNPQGPLPEQLQRTRATLADQAAQGVAPFEAQAIRNQLARQRAVTGQVAAGNALPPDFTAPPRPEPMKPVVADPGQRVFDPATGRQIAANEPLPPKPERLGEGESFVDPRTGSVIASNERQPEQAPPRPVFEPILDRVSGEFIGSFNRESGQFIPVSPSSPQQPGGDGFVGTLSGLGSGVASALGRGAANSAGVGGQQFTTPQGPPRPQGAGQGGNPAATGGVAQRFRHPDGIVLTQEQIQQAAAMKGKSVEQFIVDNRLEPING